LTFGRSGSSSSIRTWRTVRLVGVDNPRAPCSSRVHPVIASSRGSFELSKFCCRGFVGLSAKGGRIVCVWAGPSARGPRTVCRRQTVRRLGLDRPFFEVHFWRFYCIFRTVRSRVADHPPGVRGPSAPPLRTVCLGFRRVAKSFASCVSLSLWDRLGFVPRVVRSVVTTRPWQTRVGILGSEFGA
jgi:hypothetical protein